MGNRFADCTFWQQILLQRSQKLLTDSISPLLSFGFANELTGKLCFFPFTACPSCPLFYKKKKTTSGFYQNKKLFLLFFHSKNKKSFRPVKSALATSIDARIRVCFSRLFYFGSHCSSYFLPFVQVPFGFTADWQDLLSVRSTKRASSAHADAIVTTNDGDSAQVRPRPLATPTLPFKQDQSRMTTFIHHVYTVNSATLPPWLYYHRYPLYSARPPLLSKFQPIERLTLVDCV